MTKSTFTQPEKVIFSQLAIGIVDLRVYWLANRVKDIKQANDLWGQSLIVIAGFSYGGLLNEAPFNQQTPTEVENHLRALEALRLGRGQYLLDYRKPFEQAIMNDNLAGIEYFSLQKIPVFMVIRANLPNAKQLMEKLETNYKRLFPVLYKEYNQNTLHP